MPTVTTTKPINLGQLTTETSDPGLSMRNDGTTRVVAGTIAQDALQTAIDNHTAIDEASNRTTLEQQALAAMQNNRDDIGTNDTYLAIVSPTNAQVAAQVRANTVQNTRQARQINGIIRLVLGKLDATT